MLNEGFKRYFKAKLSELPGTNASPLITIQVHSKYLHTHTHTQLETKGMSPKTDGEREKKGKETLNTNAEQNWAERNRNWIKIQKKKQEMKQKNATKFVHDFCVTVTFFCLFVCSFQAFV